MIDYTNKNYAKSPFYEEAVRRFAPYVGESYQTGVVLSGKPVEVYAMFGGQWPHSSFMIPGGVMCAHARRGHQVDRDPRELEERLARGPVARVLDRSVAREQDVGGRPRRGSTRTRATTTATADSSSATASTSASTSTARASATTSPPARYFQPDLYDHPTIEGRNDALINRSGVYANGEFSTFDHLRVSEDTAHSFYKGSGLLHPWDGVTDPIDPEQGRKEGKYSWAKSPRYDVEGPGVRPARGRTAGSPHRCGRPRRRAHQDDDPLFLDIINKIGPSVMVRQLARMHEGPKYFKWVREWLDQIDLHDSFYTKPVEHESGKGFGSTEAARGSLSDWIVIEDGKIENYQVVTPTAWNIGPRDGEGVLGPIEQALVGAPIVDTSDPVELGLVARSFDSCLVCTVHAYDGKTGKELSRFVVNGMV